MGKRGQIYFTPSKQGRIGVPRSSRSQGDSLPHGQAHEGRGTAGIDHQVHGVVQTFLQLPLQLPAQQKQIGPGEPLGRHVEIDIPAPGTVIRARAEQPGSRYRHRTGGAGEIE